MLHAGLFTYKTGAFWEVNVDKPFHTAYGIEHEGFKIRKIGN